MSGTARLLLGIALSAAFTAAVIQHSQRHGRLSWVDVPVDLEKGKHSLKIAYGQWMPGTDGRQLAVLYNSLRILHVRDAEPPS